MHKSYLIKRNYVAETYTCVVQPYIFCPHLLCVSVAGQERKEDDEMKRKLLKKDTHQCRKATFPQFHLGFHHPMPPKMLTRQPNYQLLRWPRDRSVRDFSKFPPRLHLSFFSQGSICYRTIRKSWIRCAAIQNEPVKPKKITICVIL